MEQEFSLKSEVRENRLVIATSGYVNNVGGEAIATEFRKHFDRGIKHIVVDFSLTKVVNSIGMSFLIDVIDQLNDADGKVIFTNLDPAVEKMLNIMGIFTFAGKEKTVADALLAFSSQE